MITALLVTALTLVPAVVVFVAKRTLRRPSWSEGSHTAFPSTETMTMPKKAARRRRTAMAGFRRVRSSPPLRQGGFRKIHETVGASQQTPPEDNVAKENGTVRRLGTPTEPAVDWVTGRVLHPRPENEKA